MKNYLLLMILITFVFSCNSNNEKKKNLKKSITYHFLLYKKIFPHKRYDKCYDLTHLEALAKGKKVTLKKLNEIEKLDLTQGYYSDKDFQYLKDLKNLKILKIGTTRTGPGRLYYLENGFSKYDDYRKISKLELNVIKFQRLLKEGVLTSDSLIRELRTYGILENLTELDISFIANFWGCFSYLRSADKLVKLNVSHVSLLDEDFKILGEMKNLTSLNVNDTPLNDKSFKYLKGLKNLKSLDLTGNYISDKSINIIATFKKLEKLSILYTKISNRGEKKLKKLLPHCKFFPFD